MMMTMARFGLVAAVVSVVLSLTVAALRLCTLRLLHGLATRQGEGGAEEQSNPKGNGLQKNQALSIESESTTMPIFRTQKILPRPNACMTPGSDLKSKVAKIMDMVKKTIANAPIALAIPCE